MVSLSRTCSAILNVDESRKSKEAKKSHFSASKLENSPETNKRHAEIIERRWPLDTCNAITTLTVETEIKKHRKL